MISILGRTVKLISARRDTAKKNCFDFIPSLFVLVFCTLFRPLQSILHNEFPLKGRIFVESFFENVKRHTMEHRDLAVGEKEENVVLQFKPEPRQTMYIACLWSRWTDAKEPDLRGFAAITDEPPADVAAAGHDRCIINLKSEHVEAWLTPEGRPRQELQAILSDRAVPVFHHEVSQAA